MKQNIDLGKEVVTKYLEQWAEDAPDKVHLFYGEQNKEYTFKKVNDLANSIAHELQSRGIKKGDRISLFLKNPLVTSLAMYGIWKCGAVFCPINFNYRGKLLSYQINDTNPKLIFTEQDMVEEINEIVSDIETKSLIIHEPQQAEHDFNETKANKKFDSQFEVTKFDELLEGKTDNLNLELHYYDAANIIYTSGTTGPAKGVVQAHRWINMYSYYSRLLLTPEDAIYNDLPLYHVGGAFFNVAKGTYAGCTVGLWDKFSPNDFWDRVASINATSATLLDVMIPWLMKAESSENDRNNTLNKIHMQPLPSYHNQVAERFGFDFISCGFGQTETGNPLFGLINECSEGEGTPAEYFRGYNRDQVLARAEEYGFPIFNGKDDLKKGIMGIPTPNYEIKIFNENDEEVPVGEVGEMVMRPKIPHMILKEYFNKPESTVESFSNLWFHSGDAAYIGEDGYYYFVDRLGGVIRCRGEKFSSYQVEDVINGHPKVDLCAVFPVAAKEGDEDDVAVYIIAKEGMEIREEEINEWASEQLPKYMRPSYIRFVSEIPRTPTNKIEKYKLKEELLGEL